MYVVSNVSLRAIAKTSQLQQKHHKNKHEESPVNGKNGTEKKKQTYKRLR